MITNIIRYQAAIYYITSITSDRFSTLLGVIRRVQKTLNNKHAEKTNMPLSVKKCNTKQYDTAIPISWGHVQGSILTDDMDNKSHRTK